MRISFVLWPAAVVAALFAPLLAFGVEIPAITPLEFPVVAEPEAHWIWTVLASEIVAAIAGWLALKVYDLIMGTRYAKAYTVIQNAVTACYQEYVRVVKAGRADGKLTLGEKDEALRYAYRKAVEMARTEGFDLLKIFAKETVVTVIERFVGAAKMPRAAKVAAGPLADLPA